MEDLIKKSRLEVSLCFQTGLTYYLKGLLLFDYNFIVLLFSLNFCILRRIHHFNQCAENRSFTHRIILLGRTVVVVCRRRHDTRSDTDFGHIAFVGHQCHHSFQPLLGSINEIRMQPTMLYTTCDTKTNMAVPVISS